MPKAIGQFTIYDFHDVQSSAIAPTNPTKDMIWLDTSVNPPVMKMYNGTDWVIVNDVSSITSSHTTQLNVHQGKIDTLIQDTTIVKDGQTLKLKDDYSSLVQDVAGFKTTVGTTYSTKTELSTFINNTYTPALSNMQNNLDKKTTSYYSVAPPHSEFTNISNNTVYNTWVGDLWYNSNATSKKTYIYTKTVNGTGFDYKWLQQEIPVDIFNTITGKKTIYTVKPTSYAINDLWILESDTVHTAGKTGEILTCTTTSATYNATHWVKKVSYTDDTYAKKVEGTVTQTAIDLTAKFSNSGGGNLVKDGQFRAWDWNNGKWWWWHNKLKIYGRGSYDVEGTSVGFYSEDTTEITLYSNYLEFEPTTTYTLSINILKENNVNWYDVGIEFKRKDGSIISYTSCLTNGYTFTTPEDCWHGYLCVKHGGRSNVSESYVLWVNNATIYKGRVQLPWSPHHSESYDGITKIDANGVQVSHSNVSSKTKMSADGFSIVDENDEVLAWLSSKKQWTELNVDKIYAKNILSEYQGPGTLYVNHSFVGGGDGSSSKPFSSFAALQNYLGTTPIINKDLTINILNPGFEITEQFCLHSLVGCGYIQINYDANITHRIRGNGAFAIRFYQIQKYITFSGGRSGYNATNGALITDDGNGHGMWVSDVSCIYIGYISINCKNWGIVTERTRCYNLATDFGKCYNAIELRDCSIYYMYDCCGGNTDFCRVQSGSIAHWGDDSGGIRPRGNVIAYRGLYYSYGSGRAETDSYRFSTASPTPTVPATSNYSQSFGKSSFQSYQYQWSNWSTDGSCKQGSWGYGLRGGHIFFDITSIRSFLSGTVQDGNTITLTRAGSGGLSGGSNVYINGSNCGGASGTPSYSNQTWLGTLAWGETKTFALPKSIVDSLKSGGCSSLAVYVNSTAQGDYVNISDCSITLKVNK